MANYYNRRSGGNSYGNNYGNNRRGNNNYGNNRRGSGQVFKKSGCTRGKTKDGDMFLHGWNKSKRRGLTTFTAFKQSEGKTKDGDVYHKFLVKVVTDGSPKEQLFTGFWNPATQKMTIPELFRGMVANPNAPAGRTSSGKMVKGYFGTYNMK